MNTLIALFLSFAPSNPSLATDTDDIASELAEHAESLNGSRPGDTRICIGSICGDCSVFGGGVHCWINVGDKHCTGTCTDGECSGSCTSATSPPTRDIRACPEQGQCLECWSDPEPGACPPATCEVGDWSFSAPCEAGDTTTAGFCIGSFCVGCIAVNGESSGVGLSCWIGGCSASCTTTLGCTSTGCGGAT